MAKKWIQSAVSKMRAKGTVGKFARHAKAEGESVQKEANEVLRNPKASTKLKREAVFAKNMSKLRKKK